MYYYLYDSFLNEKKYQTNLAKIESRLASLGINGKINQLSFLKNIKQILQEEIKRGVKTVVIVGNDQTIGQIINLAADLDVVLGIIPIGGRSNKIARLLGIPSGEAACNALSSRIIKKIDLGKINNHYFLTSIELGGKNFLLECDQNFFLQPANQKNENIITIANLDDYPGTGIRPNDGRLNLFIKNIQKKLLVKKEITASRLTAEKIKITSSKTLAIFLNDEQKIFKTPAEIKISPKKIRIIVGKHREF